MSIFLRKAMSQLAQPIPQQYRDHGLGIMNRAVESPAYGLLPGEDFRLHFFILFEPLGTGR